jgi:hypothetical protein
MMTIILSIFCLLTLSGGENESRWKMRAMRRDSIVPYPHQPITIVTYPLPDASPVSLGSDSSLDEEEADAQQIDADLDTLVNEIRVQVANDDEPGLRSYPREEAPAPVVRQPSRRDIHVPHIPVVPPPGKSFWDKVLEWCSYDRRGRR